MYHEPLEPLVAPPEQKGGASSAVGNENAGDIIHDLNDVKYMQILSSVLHPTHFYAPYFGVAVSIGHDSLRGMPCNAAIVFPTS